MERDNHRILKSEFQGLVLTANGSDGWQFDTTAEVNYRALPGYNDQFWVSENKIDLTGYAMEDLTVYFTDSFEQRGGVTFVDWEEGAERYPLNSYTASNYELFIISSVPLSDDNLAASFIASPGFQPFSSTSLDFGNFDRTHIIHGSGRVWTIDSTFGADALTAKGGAYCIPIQYWNFSSLEPTSADALYCYRFVALTNSWVTGDNYAGLTNVWFPPARILLGSTVSKEPELEYMMRLKRSYELANQV